MSTNYYLKKEHNCDFCGRQTNFYFVELDCFICPGCLEKYKKTSVMVENNQSTNKKIYLYIDTKASV
jgi:ribosomal protein L37AE/L43A